LHDIIYTANFVNTDSHNTDPRLILIWPGQKSLVLYRDANG